MRAILNLIRGVVRQSRAGAADAESFTALVGDRIQALARAHDQVTSSNWGPGSLSEMLSVEAA